MTSLLRASSAPIKALKTPRPHCHVQKEQSVSFAFCVAFSICHSTLTGKCTKVFKSRRSASKEIHDLMIQPKCSYHSSPTKYINTIEKHTIINEQLLKKNKKQNCTSLERSLDTAVKLALVGSSARKRRSTCQRANMAMGQTVHDPSVPCLCSYGGPFCEIPKLLTMCSLGFDSYQLQLSLPPSPERHLPNHPCQWCKPANSSASSEDTMSLAGVTIQAAFRSSRILEVHQAPKLIPKGLKHKESRLRALISIYHEKHTKLALSAESKCLVVSHQSIQLCTHAVAIDLQLSEDQKIVKDMK